MSDEIEIKGCPFCGEESDYIEDNDTISCENSTDGCGFYMNVNGTLTEAIKLWNTRTPQLNWRDPKEIPHKGRGLMCYFKRSGSKYIVRCTFYNDNFYDGFDEVKKSELIAWTYESELLATIKQEEVK